MSEIDDVMNIDPLELTKHPEELVKIIAYMRKQRANFEAGIKPKKEKGEAVKIDSVLSALGSQNKKEGLLRR